MSDEIRAKVNEICETAGITFEVEYVRREFKHEGNDHYGQPRMWEHDLWKCTITRGKRSFTIEYSMGTGHNKKQPTFTDVIWAIHSDESFLESEPDQVTYETGKKIVEQSKKAKYVLGKYYEIFGELVQDY